jgi:hypothetical protein
MRSRIDHRMWGAPALEPAITDMAHRFGRRPVRGGPRPSSRSRRIPTICPGWRACSSGRHPSAALTAVGRLERLTLGTPHPAELRGLLGEVGLAMQVEAARLPAVRAEVQTPRGLMSLESSPETVGWRFG